MSGKKQHYIPRLVIRQFDARQNGKKEHVYSFHKDYSFSLKAIKSVASEFQFYSEDNIDSLDGAITKYENDIKVLRDKLLMANNNQLIDCECAAEYVTHLMLRTDHMRSVMTNAFEALVKNIFSIFKDEGSLHRLFLDEQNLPTDLFRKELSDLLRNPELLTLPMPLSVLQKMAIFSLREQFPDFYVSMEEQIDKELPQIPLKSKEAIERAHKKALEKSLAPPARILAMKDLKWYIVESSVENFILPDCIAIGLKEENQPPFPLLYEDIEQVKFALTPLSPYKLLVGYKIDNKFDFTHVFNEYAAKCSNKFFISSYVSDELKDLKSYIALSSSSIIDKQVDIVSKSIISNYIANNKNINSLDYIPETNFSYSVVINDLCSEANPEVIVDIVRRIIQRFSVCYDISILESISFTGHNPSSSIQDDNFFAYTLPDLKDKKLRISIVAHSNLAAGLISPDSQIRSISLHVFLAMLAQIASRTAIYSQFPQLVTEQNYHDWRDNLWNSMFLAWEGYFSRRVAANVYPEVSGEYADAVNISLEAAVNNIELARLQYYKTNDFEAFYAQISSCVTSFMLNLSLLLGHLDGLGEVRLCESGELEINLGKYGLAQWANLLREDYKKLHKNFGKWPSKDVFAQLVEHIERIFWNFKFIIWTEKNNSVRYLLG